MTSVHDAMAVQLDRHNNDPVYLRQQLDQANEVIANLRRQLKDKNVKLQHYEAMDDDSSPSTFTERETRGEVDVPFIEGRPVLTLLQVARQIGVKYHSAARYARDGAWQQTRMGGTVYVFADQSITKPLPKRRKKASHAKPN